jgi:hypothetical protein
VERRSLGQPHRLPVPAQLPEDYGIIHHNNQLTINYLTWTLINLFYFQGAIEQQKKRRQLVMENSVVGNQLFSFLKNMREGFIR